MQTTTEGVPVPGKLRKRSNLYLDAIEHVVQAVSAFGELDASLEKPRWPPSAPPQALDDPATPFRAVGFVVYTKAYINITKLKSLCLIMCVMTLRVSGVRGDSQEERWHLSGGARIREPMLFRRGGRGARRFEVVSGLAISRTLSLLSSLLRGT